MNFLRTLQFLDELDVEIRNRLGLEQEFWRLIDKNWRRYIASAHFYAGRWCLLAGDHSEAKRNFLAALREGYLVTKVKALVGIFALVTGMDLERLALLLGRISLK